MTDKNIEDKKMTFRRVDSGCTATDYRARFTSTDCYVAVTVKWTPDESCYRVYPMICDIDNNLWVSPAICIYREFQGVKTPMDLEALVIERMKSASISGSKKDFTINWGGVPAFKVKIPGHESVHVVTTVYKDDVIKEFVLDNRTIRFNDDSMKTGVITDYNPHNPSSLKIIRVDNTTLIGSAIETE